MVPSGYGQQVKLLAPRLKAAGHDVAVSAFYGLSGSAITWEGIPILPAGQAPYGTDVLAAHARNHGADVVITLMDFWKLAPVAPELRDLKVLAWLPVDCAPLGRPDRETLLRSGAMPVAMSRFGQRQIEEAGLVAPYVPHAVDTAVFKPPADRRALRRELGVDDFFLIGICAANSDAMRKGFPEQFQAFARFAERRPDARLMVHSRIRSQGGLPLDHLAEDLGITDRVLWSDQYAMTAGLMSDAIMADWYGALDILSACSYGEGFGVPILEAQACGTPVAVTDASGMTEFPMVYLVDGSPWWNPVHRAWWVRPDVEQIEEAYSQMSAVQFPAEGRAALVEWAAEFDADRVVAEYWLPLLEQVEKDMQAVATQEEISFDCWCGCNGNVADHNLAGGRR